MTAKEMFERLGYEYNKNSWGIEYSKEEQEEYNCITFYLDDKTFYKQTGYEFGNITLEELQAINKQIEELGWK